MYSSAISRYLLHHVFLPPKTPQKDDFRSEFGHVFLDLVIDSLLDFKTQNPDFSTDVIDSMLDMCSYMKSVHDQVTQDVIESELLAVLRTILRKGGCVPIYVRAQNAAVLVWNIDGEIRFDFFEVTPHNEAVMTTQRRLIRKFPDVAVAIEYSKAVESGFCEQIAKTLALMSHQPVPGQQPKVKKAGMWHDEDRDTTDPGMVTGFFSHVLAGIGSFVSVKGIVKNTREQVSWMNAKSPWRRAPMWLVMRVALNAAFLRLVPDEIEARDNYKQFMLTLMSRVMNLAPVAEMSSDELHIMNTKLSRRMAKQSNIAPDILAAARSAMGSNHDELVLRWNMRQQRDTPTLNFTKLKTLDFAQDTRIELPGIDECLRAIESAAHDCQTRRFRPVSTMTIYQDDVLPQLGTSDDIIALHAFENWVSEHLDQWREQQSHPDACIELAKLTQGYHTRANHCYADNPQAISLMVLVTLELWIACDKLALAICPMLEDYRPGIQTSALQNLLLPIESQVQRLAVVEQYMGLRETAIYPTSELFCSATSVNSFAVRFFDQSAEHQSVLHDIEIRAEGQRQDKLREWHRKRGEYLALMQAHHNRDSCDFYEVVTDHKFNIVESCHSPSCIKCDYKRRANALTINVHEWPLPEDKELAKTVVFELSIPTCFGYWRDAVFYVQLKVLQNEYTSIVKPRSSHRLVSDRHLANRFRTTSGLRVGLLSEVKAHIVTHRSGKQISTATEVEICPKNAFSYQYFDNDNGCFVRSISLTERIPQLCTYRLPPSSHALQQFIYRPCATPQGPSSNLVISSQSACPSHLSLQEYKDMCSMPLGVGLQWMTLATELLAPSIDLNKTESLIIILQCLYQVGRPATDESGRPNHIILKEREYANKLHHGLVAAFDRVKSNWESNRALDIMCTVARRLISSTTSEPISREYLEYLDKVRDVAMDWTLHLNKKCQEMQREQDRLEFQRRSLETALVCASTFDLDEELRAEVLSSSDRAGKLLRCSIIIRNLEHVLEDLKDGRFKVLHERHLRVLYDEVNRLAMDQVALNDAVEKTCVSYHDGSPWTTVDGTVHWVQSAFTPPRSGSPSEIHLNLLTGELLVNGSPLNRLPTKYEKCQLYKTLFGTSAIEVVPGTSSVIEYSSKEEYQGYSLDFGWYQRNNRAQGLLVQASNPTTSYLLLPSDVFEGSLPKTFQTNFVHWYDIKAKTVEFRRKQQPWNNDGRVLWVLRQSNEDSKWRLIRARDEASVIGTKSETLGLLADIFAPLAKPLQMHAYFHPVSSHLEIGFDGINLGFSLIGGETSLTSKDFPGMRVDNDQSLGALIGFSNKFLLTDGTKRKVLIVEGPISLHSSHETGVTAGVELVDTRYVHAYTVDPLLGRLVGNGTLRSALYLAYISALTSFCLVDPLTKTTGTESALTILRSAAVRSFDYLTQADVDLLSLIAKLTPKRSFYPDNERVMESIKWHPTLGCLAQHAGFDEAVKVVFAHAQRSLVLFPKIKLNFVRPDSTHLELHRRDKIRSSTFHVSGYGAEEFSTKYDVAYPGRSQNFTSREKDAYKLSYTIFHSLRARLWNIPAPGRSWHLIQEIGSTNGCNHMISRDQIKYDATHITDGKKFVAQNWLALHKVLIEKTDSSLNRFAVVFWLSTLACSKLERSILDLLAQGYVSDMFSSIRVPEYTNFRISDGTDVSSLIRNQIQQHLHGFHHSPENSLTKLANESRRDFGNRVRERFLQNQEKALKSLELSLKTQWPCEVASIPTDGRVPVAAYIDQAKAVAKANEKFKSCFSNRSLMQYFEVIETTAASAAIQEWSPHGPEEVTTTSHRSISGFLGNEELFKRPAPALENQSHIPRTHSRQPGTQDSGRLQQFICDLRNSSDESTYRHIYVDDLGQSLEALRKRVTVGPAAVPELDQVRAYHTSCEDQVRRIEISLHRAVTRTSLRSGKHRAEGEVVGHSPRVGPNFFLRQLNSKSWRNLDGPWKACIVKYGLAITALQRAERTLAALSCGRAAEAAKEWEHVGHGNWDPMEHPESLLLEVESGILIRDVQEQIAQHMRAPEENRNTSMQLNMGEGKSSVIVPMTCLHLADGSRLVRVLAAKPQFKQMAQMLVSKLGGLLNRRVYYLPFSRSLKPSTAMAAAIDSICRECMAEGGVLLVQPEHLLSFQLMVLERPIRGEKAVGESLLQIHRFLEDNTRDIVDESDENFNVRFELIYTMGTQQPIELGAERWVCIAEILDMVRDIVPPLASTMPDSFQMERGRPGSFPLIRVLQPDGGALLIAEVARRICQNGINGLPIATQTEQVKAAVLAYITEWDLQPENKQIVEDEITGFFSETIRPRLLLLRGLLAGGVLLFAFSRKRWCVNYGLHPDRDPPTRLAVPYRAKDQPSLRADFSHPDVVIILTYLTYYYSGLTDSDLLLTFENLLTCDRRDFEYGEWVTELHNLPTPLCSLQSINIKDQATCTSVIFPELRTVKRVVDFFLSRIVFPKELRVFPEKLSASGWDIGRVKQHPTTAFSGTCDTHLLLPLSVKFLPLPEQQHTNALVLDYLLQPENAVCRLPGKPTGSDADWIISTAMSLTPSPRVILDVGAQLLELSNKEMAQAWLFKHEPQSAEAAVFFDDQDELCVVDREGNVEPLRASPFLDRLESCLVFLDEAHTRGTDLRLPADYRAAVTLGPNLTKDRLVQACMRMRKLGQGQTVVFMIPPEIQLKILDSTSKAQNAEITVSDVLRWAISETHADLRRSMPLWASQGEHYFNRQALWSTFCDANFLSCDQASGFLEDEAKSLDQRYRPKEASTSGENANTRQGTVHEDIANRCRLIDQVSPLQAPLEEEQEKELSPEMEEERHVERPAAADPAKHDLHPDVIAFASTGMIVEGSKAYISAFASLDDLSAASHFDVCQLADTADVLVTNDFARTVKKYGRSYILDDFLRSPKWILTSTHESAAQIAMIISPYEAQELIPVLRSGSWTTLHVYKPHWNTQYPALNRLDFFSYPFNRSPQLPTPLTMTQLNLFAGLVTFSSQDEYQDTCRFLSLAYDDCTDLTVALDGFVLDERGSSTPRLSSSPVAFIKALTNIRTHHQDLAKTHISRLLAGVRLRI